MQKYHDSYELLIQHLLLQAIDRRPNVVQYLMVISVVWHSDRWFLFINHFRKQQQQPAAAATTGCSDQNTFLGCSVCEIHNEQSCPLSQQQQLRCPWGAHFAPDSSSGAAPWPVEQNSVVKTNHRVIPVLCCRPLTIQLYWEEGEMGEQCVNTCAFIIVLITPLSPRATASSLLDALQTCSVEKH